MRLRPDHLCVVLVEPTLPANIGSAARAMNNLGVQDLRLVNPCDHQSREARQTGAHSWHILRRATLHPTLADAVAGQHLVVGTTARFRDRHARITPLPEIHELIPPEPGRVALVFGRESSGLTNAEMAVCNAWIHIPTFGRSRSFNLAHAVAVTLYEVSRHYAPPARRTPPPTPLAASRDVEAMKGHLARVLQRVRFLRPRQEAHIWTRISDLAGRARLTDLDVRMIRGFLHRIELSLHPGAQPSQSAPIHPSRPAATRASKEPGRARQRDAACGMQGDLRSSLGPSPSGIDSRPRRSPESF
ncbi:MAG: RNA methyltransferase [Verrucomicrobia bacterium]|nr:RNA methyltransferase [Verrucomicrobiota bacterium]